MLKALQLPINPPTDVVTVVTDMGGLARAWQSSPAGLARLEASSAVATAVTKEPRDSAGRFFNAGVSLIGDAFRNSKMNVRSRLILNALGLRLALLANSDLRAALIEHSGLSCAVNLAGAFSDTPPQWIMMTLSRASDRWLRSC